MCIYQFQNVLTHFRIDIFNVFFAGSGFSEQQDRVL